MARPRNSGFSKSRYYREDGSLTYQGFYIAVYNVDKEAAKRLSVLKSLNLFDKNLLNGVLRYQLPSGYLFALFIWGRDNVGHDFWFEVYQKLKGSEEKMGRGKRKEKAHG